MRDDWLQASCDVGGGGTDCLQWGTGGAWGMSVRDVWDALLWGGQSTGACGRRPEGTARRRRPRGHCAHDLSVHTHDRYIKTLNKSGHPGSGMAH